MTVDDGQISGDPHGPNFDALQLKHALASLETLHQTFARDL